MYKNTRKKRSQRLKKQTTAIRNNEILLPCLSVAWFMSENSVLDTLYRTRVGRVPPAWGWRATGRAGVPMRESRAECDPSVWSFLGVDCLCSWKVYLCLEFSTVSLVMSHL